MTNQIKSPWMIKKPTDQTNPERNQTMNTITPGPWKAEGKSIKAISHGTWFTIARVDYKKLTDEGNAANAQLIAAAPELLQALTALYESFAITPYPEGGTLKGNMAKHDVIKYNQDVKNALNAARAAIQKATE